MRELGFLQPLLVCQWRRFSGETTPSSEDKQHANDLCYMLATPRYIPTSHSPGQVQPLARYCCIYLPCLFFQVMAAIVPVQRHSRACQEVQVYTTERYILFHDEAIIVLRNCLSSFYNLRAVCSSRRLRASIMGKYVRLLHRRRSDRWLRELRRSRYSRKHRPVHHLEWHSIYGSRQHKCCFRLRSKQCKVNKLSIIQPWSDHT